MFPALNYFRFFLAVSVVLFHLNRSNFVQSGNIAVWCFFLVSGYLVTRILNTTYVGRPADFLVNRFLRIFPTYWVALAIGLLLIYFSGGDIRKFHEAIYLDSSFNSIFRNVFIFGLMGNHRVVPPAWSLAIELNWYLVIFCGSFFPGRFFIAFLVANLALPFLIHFGLGQDFYVSGAGFAFALGALRYHVDIPVHRVLSLVCMAMIPLFMFIFPYAYGWRGHGGVSTWASMNFVFVSFLVYLAMPVMLKSGPQRGISDLVGNLSYPVFLTHWYAAYLCWDLFDLKRGTFIYAASSLAMSIFISCLIIVFVENPIAEIRKKYRMNIEKTST